MLNSKIAPALQHPEVKIHAQLVLMDLALKQVGSLTKAFAKYGDWQWLDALLRTLKIHKSGYDYATLERSKMLSDLEVAKEVKAAGLANPSWLAGYNSFYMHQEIIECEYCNAGFYSCPTHN